MGIDGKESVAPAGVWQQLAGIIEEEIQDQIGGSISPAGIAQDAVAIIAEQFDIFPKGELYEEIQIRRREVDGRLEPARESRLVSDWKREGHYAIEEPPRGPRCSCSWYSRGAVTVSESRQELERHISEQSE